MKYFLFSDIHGSLPRLEQALAISEKEHCDMLCLLGDILNYGPRNGVPEGLDAMGIARKLNTLSDRIVAVRGNCDAEIDQMLLEFPMMGDSTMLVDEGHRILLTHGHLPLPKGGYDAVVTGHTHLWQLEKQESQILCNTGSITFPKGGNVPTVATYDHGLFRILDLNGTLLKELSF